MIDLSYLDGEETRSWELLKDIDRRQAVEQFPDFDVAYLRAAYITPSIDDHEMADTAYLTQGLAAAVRKSELLGRLSCWHAWNAHHNEFAYGSAASAIKLAVQSLCAGPPPTAPGSRLQALQLLTELVRGVDRKLSDDLYWKSPRHKPGERQAREIRQAVETCLHTWPQLAQEVRDLVRSEILPRF